MRTVRARSTVTLVLVILLSLLLLVGCSQEKSSQDETATTKDQVTVVMNKESEPAAGFDPLASWGAGEHVHEPLIQSTLITTDTDMNIVNDLATSYESSTNGMQWTFVIRDDVRFTDGEPLTAHDVAFTINGVISSERSEADLSMVDKATALDDRTVVIDMKKPYNAFLYTLAVIGIVPEHAYGNGYGSNPIGSGRYMLEQWDRGQQAILVVNPDYYGDAPQMKRVVIAFMEEDAALAAVKSGQVDIAYTSATYSDQTVQGYNLLACKSVDSRGISLPTIASGGTKADGLASYEAGNDVTADIAIRKAINYAIDRQTMVDNVLNGYGQPAYSVCDGMPWASADMKVETDRTKAKQIIEEAGWTLGNDGVYEKDGTRAAFELWYPSSDSVRQALSSEFANQMREVGIEVSLHGGGWDDLYPHEFSSPILWGWGSNSPNEVYSLYYSSGGANFSSYESDQIDSYIDAALAETTIADSYELWQKAQWDGTSGVAPQGEATWAWFVSVDHLYFQKDDLKVAEQKLHPHGHGWSLVNNIDKWTWV